MPKRASRHQARRLSRVSIDSRHHAASGLSFEGESNFAASAAMECVGAQRASDAATSNNGSEWDDFMRCNSRSELMDARDGFEVTNSDSLERNPEKGVTQRRAGKA